MSYYPNYYEIVIIETKVELDLSNYAAKSDLK